MSKEYLTGYPANDYRDYIEHSAGPWKKHKYIAIRNGRYIYPEDITSRSSRVDALMMPIVDAKIRDRKKTKAELGIARAFKNIGFNRVGNAIEKQNRFDRMISKSKMKRNRDRILEWRMAKKKAEDDFNTQLVQRTVDDMAMKRNKRSK